MLRVGHGQTKSFASPVSRTQSTGRLVALTACALALGAGATVFGVSFVQAGDEASPRAFLTEEAQRGRVQRSANLFESTRVSRPVQVSAPSFYAPAPRTVSAPIFRTTLTGALLEPPISLNPFAPRTTKAERNAAKKNVAKIVALDLGDNPALNMVSGAANTMRSICVRLCDGYHAPIGYLNAVSDLPAHEALCRASNPGLPVKAFRVAAGAATIDDATSSDGKTYASLPMAYAYEKSSDQSCRPAIALVNERRVSLLRDFTLRAGDTVVLDGRAKVFNGSSQWPYRASDFRDFRQSQQLNAAQRQRIDNIIGLSRLEASRRAERRNALVREASLATGSMSDIGPAFLRGTVGAEVERGPVRVIAPQTLGTPR
jgi:Protein of unknown function (DUF2865)